MCARPQTALPPPTAAAQTTPRPSPAPSTRDTLGERQPLLPPQHDLEAAAAAAEGLDRAEPLRAHASWSAGAGTARWRDAAASALALQRLAGIAHGAGMLPGLDVKRDGPEYANM